MAAIMRGCTAVAKGSIDIQIVLQSQSSSACKLYNVRPFVRGSLRLKNANLERRHRLSQTVTCQVTTTERRQAAEEMVSWLSKNDFPEQPVRIQEFGKEGLGCAAARDIQVGEAALSIPENFTVTAVDVATHPVISAAADGRGDLIGLTLWLLYERSLGSSSLWHPFLQTLPESTLSPLLWSSQELEELLKGSPVLSEVQGRLQALEAEFNDLQLNFFTKEAKAFPPAEFSFDAFKKAFSVILSQSAYLATADVLALVPVANCANHRGSCKASLDYREELQDVALLSDRSYARGDQVFTSYGRERPNSDLLISYGFVDEDNPNDFIELQVSMVPGDRLFEVKRQVAQDSGFSAEQSFPLFPDRFPTQLLTYVRLSRMQDVALLSKVAFERDSMLDQGNEYETLMLLLADCRERLSLYATTLEDDTRLLNRGNLNDKERLAAQLRRAEKRILTNTMTALRARLAPIRGVPTKGGNLKDPNSDIKEMFDVMEQGLSAPRKFFSGLLSKPEK